MQYFIYGCSSGFGKAITLKLISEGHIVCGFSRSAPAIEGGKNFHHYKCDVTSESQLVHTLNSATETHGIPDGIVLNAGGPAPGTALSTKPEDYRNAYNLVFEWKVRVVLHLIPHFSERGKGNILFIESQSLKQPIPGLVLSNSMRLAVAGFAKTMSAEVAGMGIRINILAPGSHDTPAIERVIQKRADAAGISVENSRIQMEKSIPTGRFGKAEELANLACWLLSDESTFITGQTISHDGGNISHIFG
ncbi:MAG: SDR family oxidoreductase [Balneolia bacterium]|nr:SDR family oxidoreductase [Balneolia bacterium]